MKKRLLFALAVLCLLACQNSLNQPKSEEPDQLPADFLFAQRAYPSGQIDTKAYSKAIQWKRTLGNTRGTDVLWEFSGPVNIGGRITDIEIPSNDAQTYYVGAASGGIFKTTNAGSAWQPIFDDQEMLSIGDIEISRNNNNLIWVGTGEVNAGGGSLAYDGDGVYKSTDGGLSWTPQGLPDTGSIGKILIDPNDDNTIFVAAMGPLFRNDNNRGVYRSTDGGQNWEQRLFLSDSTGIIDMAIHPSNGEIVYAAAWERIRRPNRRQYGGETSGLFRSLDGGDTWQEMTNGLPTAPNDKGRISIDISRSNPNVLYARYATAGGSIQGVYRTSDGGDTWVEVNSSQLNNVGFHWWFRGIFVDPSDEDIIYNVDFDVQKSTDGGNNWFDAFPNVHVDQHALAFNENIAGEVLLGNDGGFYKSGNDGSSWTKDETLPITQFYRFHVDASNGNKIYGGTQDNSTMRTQTGGLDDWEIIFGGDGFQPLVDPDNTNVIYALSQRGNLGKSTNNGSTFNGALNGVNPSDRNNWDTPIAFDPANSQTLYYGTQRLYRTTNAAGNWTAISEDLTDGPYEGNLAFGTITSIDVSVLDSDLILVGTDDGKVWVTEDGGENWNAVSTGLPDRWVTKVLTDTEDSNTIYVTFSGYRFGEDNGHVYRSTNLGANWTNIGTSLPDVPVNDIVKDDFGNLFLGTDIGVIGSDDEGNSWAPVGTNLPSVVITDMHLDQANDLLYVGTYGRSSYRLDISTNILELPDLQVNGIQVFPNPTDGMVNIQLPEGLDGRQLQVYDQLGRLLKSISLEGTNSRINLSDLSSGVYFLKLTNLPNWSSKLILK
ncbi:T9SS type A sorting domain-containing protein [Aureitalea marina]|uniref:Secretion system C-terminal sorting domain-containing protein n=1 Tax=Aureitalea marina TaxID=930804 RepID=A0A2S7KQU5_9FLAO|nr:T9SS type A sorting domain-containing protein [Aureitalea marina]PQB04995.1 hypothetical protein BST85_08895 [Aureitalea marina]